MKREKVIEVLIEVADKMYSEGAANGRYTDDELRDEMIPFADKLLHLQQEEGEDIIARLDSTHTYIPPESEKGQVTEEEIKKAASDYEKIACCETDHPFLKEYVNDDFTAGANWMQQELK